MYDIATTEINSFNGLGGDDVPASVLTSHSETPATTGGSTSSGMDWTSIVNTGLQVGGQVAQTAINANHQGSTSTTTGGNYAGGNPSTYSPSTRNYGTTSSESKTDYLPWIIGGVAVLGLFMIMMNNKK